MEDPAKALPEGKGKERLIWHKRKQLSTALRNLQKIKAYSI